MISHRERVDRGPEPNVAPSPDHMRLHRPRHDQGDEVARDGQDDREASLAGAVADPGEEEDDGESKEGADGSDGVGFDTVEAERPIRFQVSVSLEGGGGREQVVSASSGYIDRYIYIHNDTRRIRRQRTPGGKHASRRKVVQPPAVILQRSPNPF